MKNKTGKNAVPILLTISAVCIFVAHPLNASAQSADEAADVIVRSSGLSGGVCVVLGREDADLALSVLKRGSFTVHGLYDDRGSLDKARKEISYRGVYGQVSADIARYDRLGYAENLVSIIVADDYARLKSKGLSVEEVFRVLRPRGVVFLGGSSVSAESAPAWAARAKSELAGAGMQEIELIRAGGLWLKATKPWPSNIDEWTHFLHGPDGNPVANDRIVGPPRHYQWISEPVWLRSHDSDSSISAVVTSRGRIFYIVDEAPISLPGDHALPDKWFLAARDAFNGVLLWKVPIKDWGWRQWKNSWFLCRPGDIPLNLEMRLVAAGEKLYVTLGYRTGVSELDARTGKLLKTYEDTEGTGEILYCKGVLILTMPAAKGAGAAKVAALNPGNGRRLWETEKSYKGTTSDYIRWKTPYGGVEPPELDPALNPVCDGRVVSIIDGNDIVCVDFKTGKEKWRTTVSRDNLNLWLGAMIVQDNVVIYADRTQLTGLSAETGEILWTQAKSYLGHLWYEWKDVFVIKGLVWTWSANLERGQFGRNRVVWPVSVNGYDLHTGKLKKEVPLGGIFKTYHHHRCYRNKATVRYILASRRGTEFVDLENGRHTVHNWVRGTCHYGMMPANGLHYAPPHPCRCYIYEKLNGFNALAPEIPAGYRSKKKQDLRRLEKGPSYDKSAGEKAGPDDWPTFRHDTMRSGATGAKISEKLELLWNAKLGREVSPPIIVGDSVFLSLTDEHQILALDSQNGQTRWNFFAGARVDSAPTYYNGMVLFGSSDGWVYCLDAVDGRLNWRFFAAPQERYIGAFDQLESAWPVHGSVLVLDGKVYFAAGRTSHLDGGIGLWALDARSGRTLHHTKIEGPSYTVDEIATNYGLAEGTLPDILLGDDDFIYMRGYRFGRGLTEQKIDTSTLSARGGFLDDNYFERAFWYSGKSNNFANLIVGDAETLYLVRMFDNTQLLDPKHYFTPGGKGYLLFAQQRDSLKKRWSRRLGVRVRAMVLAGKLLLAAGPPDVLDAKDPLGAFEGRKGGLFGVFDALSGEELAKYKLDSPAVFNGAAVANGNLYISLENGSLSVFASK